MPSVFLSYSQDDLPRIKKLEAQLKKAPDISIWRDQKKIYGKQKWPKVLGEKIAAQDFFLLAWSKNAANAAKSPFVESEWNTAIALKKKIIVCLLDKFPLPESLRSVQHVPWSHSDISSMLAVLKTDAMCKAELLDHITAKDPSEALKQAKAIFGLEALVERMKVKNRDDLFVIGAGERMISLYSQQVRALNLVYWLWRQDAKGLSRKHIVVVGAGAAGLTVAAAAACLGATVTILEANERPMAFQRGCRTRLLHPHYYEWPKDFCWKMAAGLPLLDWDEGSAGHVAETICKQFEVICDASLKITLIDSVSDISLDLLKDRRKNPVISWKAQKHKRSKKATIVLALGFGVEQTVPNLPTLSYWRDDPLEQAAFPGVLRKGEPHLQLISGTGDGGLIDVLRASLWDFDHATFFSSFAAISRGSDLETIILDKDKELWPKRQEVEYVSSDLDSFYRGLDKNSKVAGTIAEIDSLLLAHRRANYKVLWLYDAPTYWRLDSMRLLRLLVSRLMTLKGTPVEPRQGRLLKVEVIDPTNCDGFNYSVSISKHSKPSRVHGVTVRHGPDPALKLIRSVWKQLSPEQRGDKLFKDYLSNEPPTPGTYWEDGDDSDGSFKKVLGTAYRRYKEQLTVRHSKDRPAELCVKLAPGQNPVEEERKKVYRLIVHLTCAPADVRRVTYDLHPPPRWGAEKRRKERSVVLEPLKLRKNGKDKELFKKLIHAKADDTVRVRLDNGQELIDRLACGLCRHYQNHANSPVDRSNAKSAVKALLGKRSCPNPDKLANLRCLIAGSPD
jgi:hypothetical protein